MGTVNESIISIFKDPTSVINTYKRNMVPRALEFGGGD